MVYSNVSVIVEEGLGTWYASHLCVELAKSPGQEEKAGGVLCRGSTVRFLSLFSSECTSPSFL